MRIENTITKYVLKNGDLNFNLLESGDLYTIQKDYTQINLLQGNVIEGSCSNLYLRVFSEFGIHYTKLIGVNSPSRFYLKEHQAFYHGTFQNIDYTVVLSVMDNKWFWEVNLANKSPETQTVDVMYGQDIAIADINACRNNEAYVCQYIDHKVFQNPLGYTVCTRQNQGTPHYLQQGSLTRTIAYSTDGFQFFGLDYKLTNVPKALMSDTLENRNYQYEFAYTALQTERVDLKTTHSFVFYGCYVDAIDEVATESRFEDEIKAAYEQIKATPVDFNQGTKVILDLMTEPLLDAQSFSKEEIYERYPDPHHVEVADTTLLSFFTAEHSHVILKAKEALVERPHGNMLLTGNNTLVQDELISSTNYMFGLFQSHIVVGNTNFHKFTTNLRNPLNVFKLSGQRLFVKIDGKYTLLGVPSLYEVGMNYSTWLYKLADDVLKITSMVLYDEPHLLFDVQSEQGKTYDFIMTNQIMLGNHESEWPFEWIQEGNKLTFLPDSHMMSHSYYPNLTYTMVIETGNATIETDALFFTDHQSRHNPFVNISFPASKGFRVHTFGNLMDKTYSVTEQSLAEIKATYLHHYQDNMNHFQLSIEKDNKEEAQKFNDIAMWYTHNAMMHYASPHGLEQYNGAAWGTRDVCQGPFEYFLATQRFDVARDILLKVYSHQFQQNGDWPQWFMFDNYYKIQARESHGDIIVWPLRILSLYLLSTGDYAILDEKISYTDLDLVEFTEVKETMLNHVLYQVKSIQESFIQGTHLACYGGGDWDDTLQPANKALTKSMVSGWTVALIYEALQLFSQSISTHNPTISNEMKELSERIQEDYNHYVIKDGIPAGFLLFEEQGVKHMLHPSDQESGIHYRLLPFNRGIISELFTKEQANQYVEVINEHLKYPDGVRLMNKPVKYNGGKNTYFTRAETASNFGREIGLQYVHASIRYIEAMAKMGKTEEAWKYLLVLNPINIDQEVPNAEKRQSNLYFSSSDACFDDRYEAYRDYDKLKNGEVKVKSGWRVYSSGPGIYLNQLITNVLGIRILHHDLVLDPVLPTSLDGLTCDYRYNGYPLTIHYHIANQTIQKTKIIINGEEVPFTLCPNPYRQGAALLKKEWFNQSKNTVDIYM